MQYKDNIIAAIVETACQQVAAQTIKFLRGEKKGLQSGDDSGLINLWDEICVQVQGESSVMWEMYEDLAMGIIEAEACKLANHVLEAIWLQTDPGMEWDGKQESIEEDNIIKRSDRDFYFIDIVPLKPPPAPDKIPASIDYNLEDIADYIWQNYVESAAADFTNKRIQEYLDRDSSF